MALSDDPVLPTNFAIKLCEQHLIIPAKLAGAKNHLKIEEIKNMIADFQRMAICADFETCLIAFHGHKITEKQKEVLNVVYTSTKPFIMGLTVDACLQAITHKFLSKNEFGEAVKVIVEQSNVKPNETGAKMKGILVRVNKK